MTRHHFLTTLATLKSKGISSIPKLARIQPLWMAAHDGFETLLPPERLTVGIPPGSREVLFLTRFHSFFIVSLPCLLNHCCQLRFGIVFDMVSKSIPYRIDRGLTSRDHVLPLHSFAKAQSSSGWDARRAQIGFSEFIFWL